MSKRTRIFVAVLLAYAIGLGVLMYRLLGDIDPRYRESAEESLVETAHLIAATIENASHDGTLDVAALRPVFDSLYARRFEADIFGFVKTRVELRLTVEDPTTWSAPWTIALTMRTSEGPLFEYACHEGNYGLRNILEVARDEEKAAEAAGTGQK